MNRKMQLVSVLCIVLIMISTAGLAAEKPAIINQILKARPMWGPFAHGVFHTNAGDREFSIWGNSDLCLLVIFHERLPGPYTEEMRQIYDLDKRYNWIIDEPQIGGKSLIVVTTFISLFDRARFGKMEEMGSPQADRAIGVVIAKMSELRFGKITSLTYFRY